MEEWKEISRSTVVKKYERGMESVYFEMPDGSKHEYYLYTSGDPVCILAITTKKEVILAKQFRPGPGKILSELPGGGIEKGDTPQEAAERELREETGYNGKVKFVSTVWDSGYSNALRHCFVATGCEKVGEQKLDDTEFIDVELLSLADFRDHLRTGQLTDVETGYLGLDHLGLL